MREVDGRRVVIEAHGDRRRKTLPIAVDRRRRARRSSKRPPVVIVSVGETVAR